ncbi:MAG TPA: hypothetical protein VFM02_04745 [Candidatus Paceibacterota bacterium]|nr:hypothetical protein [Candidatus Paceibacterota bacterium]
MERSKAQNDDTNSFIVDIENTMALVEKGDEIEARVFFNTKVYPKYHEKINNAQNDLHLFLIFFCDLNDYFNNIERHLLGEISKDSILSSYHFDFQDDLKELKRRRG